MNALVVVFFVLFFAVFGVLTVAGLVFWIFKLIEVLQIPEAQFRSAGTDKLTWTLVVVLVGAIGGLVWHFSRRQDVLAAAGRAPLTPAGWYVEPGGSAFRWWDGTAWTEHRQGPRRPDASV